MTRRKTGSGKEEKSEVPAEKGEGIWEGNTSKDLHRGVASIKSN